VTVLEDFDLDDLDLADGIYAATPEWEGMVRQPAGPLVASAFPVKPPGAWFQNPGFAKLEPLTIQSDGHITRHIASWRDDHIGMSGRVKAPRSKSNYAFFATGVLETAEGNMVNVGQITLTGGHASLEGSVAETVAHYDNTDSAVCDVAVGEDRHGIWVNGGLRPTVDDVQIRAMRASSVSGDWRPINGSLEMVAVCAVNVPGFPIPRARVASGAVLALVAAGTGALVELALHQDMAIADEVAAAFDDRLRLVENVVLGRIGEDREALTAAIEQARLAMQTPEDRIAALRARVHPTTDVEIIGDDSAVDPDTAAVVASLRERVQAPLVAGLRDRVHRTTLVASLREQVHGAGGAVPFGDPPSAVTAGVWEDGMPIDMDIAECLQASLRARVSGVVASGLQATATKAWTADKRRKAAGRGAAMPGGRYPIADCTDVGKAVHALGRGKGDPSKIRAHIKRRAKSLGCMAQIPDTWK